LRPGQRHWQSRIAALPDLGIKLNRSQKRHIKLLRRPLRAALRENIYFGVAMRADKVAHVLHNPQDWNIHLINISRALRASCSETSDGVETTTAPVSGTVCTSEITVSPVPGGKSTSRKSSSPHSTCCKHCRMIWCSIGPLITIGLSPGDRKPTDITFTPCAVFGSIRLPSSSRGCRLVPSISGTLGP